MNAPIQISIRELHARTGHYVRKAAQQRVIVTHHGKAAAELSPLTVQEEKVPYFARRKLSAGFKKWMECGALKPKRGARDITDLISEDRNDRA